MREFPCEPSTPPGQGGSPREFLCKPLAPCLHARLFKSWKRRRPRLPNPAQLSAWTAALGVPASMDAPKRLSRPPSLQQRPGLLPTPIRIPPKVWRLTREGGLEGPLKMLWSHQATHLLPRPVQRWRVMHPPPAATCKACTGTLCPTPSRRRSSMERTLDCNGLPPRIDDSSGLSATRSISTMEPTSTVESVLPRMQNGSGFTTMLPLAPSHCTTSPTVDGLNAS